MRTLGLYGGHSVFGVVVEGIVAVAPAPLLGVLGAGTEEIFLAHGRETEIVFALHFFTALSD
jgi:hypothetical protein